MEQKIVLTSSGERETARKIKEELCYVALDFEYESHHFEGNEQQFTMPDGSEVT